MGLFDNSKNTCKLMINMLEHKINFEICAKMLDVNRRLTSTEIEEIIHKELKTFIEQV